MKKWQKIILIVVVVVCVGYAVAWSRNLIPQLKTVFQAIPVTETQNADQALSALEADIAGLLGGNLDKIGGLLTGGLGIATAAATYFRSKNITSIANGKLNEASLLGQVTEKEGALTQFMRDSEQKYDDLEGKMEERDAYIQVADSRYNEANVTLTKSQQQVIDLQSRVLSLESELSATRITLEQRANTSTG